MGKSNPWRRSAPRCGSSVPLPQQFLSIWVVGIRGRCAGLKNQITSFDSKTTHHPYEIVLANYEIAGVDRNRNMTISQAKIQLCIAPRAKHLQALMMLRLKPGASFRSGGISEKHRRKPYLSVWRNRQTRSAKDAISQGVEVQVLSWTPLFSRSK